jgi:predicted nuclease of predicted toxin-antitoxin system
MKILVDMNLSPRLVDFLKDSGIEAIHWSSIGKPNATDLEIMQFAKANDCVVITHDLHFTGILAATHGNKPSVIQIRSEDLSLKTIGKQILLALEQMGTEIEAGAIVTIDPMRSRVRLLPLLERTTPVVPKDKETDS